jgi:subtilisin family serine protease
MLFPHTRRLQRLFVFAVLAILAALAASGTRAEPATSSVIVFLDESQLSATATPSAASSVLSDAEAGDAAITHQYRSVPGFAASLTPDAIERLRSDPRVREVRPDAIGHGADNESGAMIRLLQAHALGFTGEGVTVAVIDSGVNAGHADFAGAIAHEECFMAGSGLASRCPNGSTHQVGTGAANDDLGHGTNVAGIVAGRGVSAPIGVAHGASLAIFKVLDATNTFYLSDLYAAIDQILASHPEIDVINMSLGTFSLNSPAACTSDPFFDQLREAGILSFVSSMNQTYKNGMGYPACVDSIVSVGAVYDTDIPSYGGFACTDAPAVADSVACWSNSDPTLDLLAPGCAITAPGAFGSTSTYCGTSQAAPHAAGAAALLIEQHHNSTPDEIESLLKITGVTRTDSANGVSTPRIDVLAAVSLAVFGDVSCDFRVDGEDVAAVLSYAVQGTGGGASGCPSVGTDFAGAIVGDVTCEGLVNSLDALNMLLYYANVELPPGTPECPAIGDVVR